VGVLAMHTAIDLHSFLLQSVESIGVDVAGVGQNRLGLA
jgi:hypothetical protein